MPERQISLILLVNCSNCKGATLVEFTMVRSTSIGWVSKTLLTEIFSIQTANILLENTYHMKAVTYLVTAHKPDCARRLPTCQYQYKYGCKLQFWQCESPSQTRIGTGP